MLKNKAIVMAINKRIPVILDTDIGGDIDDTWALAMMLNSPELDVRMVLADHGDTVYRARLLGRMLETAGRTDVDVGVGIRQPMAARLKMQAEWAKGYRLSRYPGRVHLDGVGAMIDMIMKSKESVILICIGPMPNIAAALDREPAIAKKARFVGMHGSIAWSHDKDHKPIAEYNVSADISACQKVFNAPWDKTITPLDTCGKVALSGAKYRAVAKSEYVLPKMVMENYRIWKKQGGWIGTDNRSSILFDCVAVYLAFSDRFLKMKRMGIRVTDDGFTVPDPKGPKVNCALGWKDLDAFEDLLVERLTA